MVPPSSFTAPIARRIARPTTTFLVRSTVVTSRLAPTDTVVQPQKRISPLLLHKTILPRSRLLSTTATTPHPGGSGSSSSHQQQQPPSPSPPAELNEEIAFGVQDATRLYVRHGLGAHRLQQIAADAGAGGGNTEKTTLVTRWQRMMETFLGTQVHVLAGLGYTPDERGLGLYNQQLAQWMQKSEPDVQERLRVAGRDTWREVMSKAFDVSLDEMDGTVNELSIVDARNVMHRVSQRMQEEDVLGEIERRCGELEAGSNPATDMAQKHVIVQEVLVNKVYLGGEPSLVSDCGFGDGERGYVLMQCMMAEHQSDPLVAQYIGSAMMKVFEAAGLNMGALQQMAAAATSSSSSTGKEEGGAK